MSKTLNVQTNRTHATKRRPTIKDKCVDNIKVRSGQAL